MTDPTYRCRPSILGTEVTWTLSARALESSTGARLPFDQVVAVRLQDAAGTLRCVIRPLHGRAVALTSRHFLGLGRVEDRSALCQPFIDELLRRVRVLSPAARLLRGMPPALWWSWCAIGVGSALVGAFGVLLVAVELWTKGRLSGELMYLLPVVAGMLLMARAVWRLVRHGRSRPIY